MSEKALQVLAEVNPGLDRNIRFRLDHLPLRTVEEQAALVALLQEAADLLSTVPMSYWSDDPRDFRLSDHGDMLVYLGHRWEDLSVIE